jgi:hypothetical protein
VRWIGLVLVAACGAKAPAESLENLERTQRETGIVKRTAKASALRPEIDVSTYTPDFHEELRWPLSAMTHPTLTPRFPIAQELAIGVDWETLCLRGVHNRTSATQKDLLAYLRGWCAVHQRDADNGVRHLAPLLGAETRGMSAAVRIDIANILVDHGSVETAERLLNKHRLRDVALLDLLAANYAEVGSPSEAFTINRLAIDADYAATDATKCRRLVKRIAFAQEANPMLALAELEDLARPIKGQTRDPLCVRLQHKVACSQHPANACKQYLADENLDAKASDLLDAFHNWPRYGDYMEWWLAADAASRALPLPGAADLAISAYEASLASDENCTGERARMVRGTVYLLMLDPAQAVNAPRLERLDQACSAAAKPDAVTATPATSPTTSPPQSPPVTAPTQKP